MIFVLWINLIIFQKIIKNQKLSYLNKGLPFMINVVSDPTKKGKNKI